RPPARARGPAGQARAGDPRTRRGGWQSTRRDRIIPAVRRKLLTAAAAAAAIALLAAGAAGAGERAKLTTVTVDTLPIANGLPLDLGISKGFFSAHGIQIKKVTLQSGNDIVLALSNHNGDIGYVGWVPAMIARTHGIKLSAVA